MKKTEIKRKNAGKNAVFSSFVLLIRFFLLNLHPINK